MQKAGFSPQLTYEGHMRQKHIFSATSFYIANLQVKLEFHDSKNPQTLTELFHLLRTSDFEIRLQLIFLQIFRATYCPSHERR